jgi:hypothetical protein
VSTKVGDQCRYGEPDGVHFSGFHDETCLEGHCSTTDDGDISYYCIPPAADGTACNGCCDGADACVNGVCVRRPAAGEPCSAYGQCQWDSKCDVAAGVCVPNVPPAPCDACLLE